MELWEAPIWPSAYRHGIPDEAIRHALRFHFAYAADPEDELVDLLLGPDHAGNLIEVGVLDTEEEKVIIHAMAARLWRFLSGRRMSNMAKTHLEKQAAAEAIADRLSNRNQEETVWRSSEPLRRIADAFRAQVAAEAEVADAVKAAREAGYSWSAIGMMLGVSKQTAQHRFGKVDLLRMVSERVAEEGSQ